MGAKFQLIAGYYREEVLTGELKPGARIPGNREQAQRHKTAVATSQKALGQLIVEGVIRTSPRGTFVSDDPVAGVAAKDRLARARPARSVPMDRAAALGRS